MFKSIKNIITHVLLLTVVTFSGNSVATIICALDCPSTGSGTSGSALPQITEIYPTDGSDLFLDTTGLIILDTNVYNNLSNLTINPSTSIYVGQSSLPSDKALPDTLELFELSYTGGASITGLGNEYVLLRQFSGTTALSITAANGILVVDANTLVVVPLPGSLIFILSGFAVLFARGTRKDNLTIS